MFRFVLLLSFVVLPFLGEATCQRCEEIRKKNEEAGNPYDYYEDFLEETGGVDERFDFDNENSHIKEE